jgi:hypothetical protein
MKHLLIIFSLLAFITPAHAGEIIIKCEPNKPGGGIFKYVEPFLWGPKKIFKRSDSGWKLLVSSDDKPDATAVLGLFKDKVVKLSEYEVQEYSKIATFVSGINKQRYYHQHIRRIFDFEFISYKRLSYYTDEKGNGSGIMHNAGNPFIIKYKCSKYNPSRWK